VSQCYCSVLLQSKVPWRGACSALALAQHERMALGVSRGHCARATWARHANRHFAILIAYKVCNMEGRYILRPHLGQPRFLGAGETGLSRPSSRTDSRNTQAPRGAFAGHAKHHPRQVKHKENPPRTHTKGAEEKRDGARPDDIHAHQATPRARRWRMLVQRWRQATISTGGATQHQQSALRSIHAMACCWRHGELKHAPCLSPAWT
jgi:hypothetical protein